MNCRVCSHTMKKFLDLGMQPIANNFLEEDNILNESFYRLEVFFCPFCYTVQIGNCPDKKKIFHKDYKFFTSTSNYMVKHFKKLADKIKNKYISNDGFIVEIGSNDGSFLKNFRTYNHLGIDPSGNVNKVAREKGLTCWDAFFCEDVAEKIIECKGKADVIVTTNCFPHMVNRCSVLRGIKKLLKPDGIWINEEAYLKNIIDIVSYDQFYNEHIFYSSVNSFRKTMCLFGLSLINVMQQHVHGGSMRYYISHEGFVSPKSIIDSHVSIENLDEFHWFEEFAEFVEESRRRFVKYILSRNKEIVGYGATAKSTTILNYCKIGTSLIRRIYDTTPDKQGKLSPGMHIPIVPYYEFERDDPKNVVLFAWNHAQEIYEKEKGSNINWILPI